MRSPAGCALRSLANFVGIVVGFLNVCKIRLVASFLPPRYPLKLKWYKKISYVRLSSPQEPALSELQFFFIKLSRQDYI